MVNTTTSVASLLSQVYDSMTSELNTSLARISSGKRVLNASDDFSAYIKASFNTSYITQYNTYSQQLQEAKGYADVGVATGNKVLADLSKLLDLANQATGVAGDSNAVNALNAQYVAIADAMNQTISCTYYANVQIYSANTAMFNANTTIAGQAMNISVGAANVAANAAITAVNQAGAALAIQAEIVNGQNYVAQMQARQDLIGNQIKLNSTIINSYKATNSILTDVNDAEEQLNVTNRQVRLQATASMMAQANSSAAAIARLFQ